jgi:hypothetical protein
MGNQSFHNAGGKSYTLEVDTFDIRNDLEHFWRSTGFCPPLPHENAYDFDFGRDMKHNLALIGSVAHGGIQQVRIPIPLVQIQVSFPGKKEIESRHLICCNCKQDGHF